MHIILNGSIRPINEILKVTTTLVQSGPGGNGNKEMPPYAPELEPYSWMQSCCSICPYSYNLDQTNLSLIKTDWTLIRCYSKFPKIFLDVAPYTRHCACKKIILQQSSRWDCLPFLEEEKNQHKVYFISSWEPTIGTSISTSQQDLCSNLHSPVAWLPGFQSHVGLAVWSRFMWLMGLE